MLDNKTDIFSDRVVETARKGIPQLLPNQVLLINKTGALSKKGSIVSLSSTVDSAVKLQSNEYDAIGVIAESGIPDGSLVKVSLSGIVEVLLEDNTSSTAGHWVKSAATDGRAIALLQPEGSGFNNAADHFKEIGHCLETKTAGTDVLCKIILHFN